MQNLHERVVERVSMSVHQFVLVFRGRTLGSAQKLMDTTAQRGLPSTCQECCGVVWCDKD